MSSLLNPLVQPTVDDRITNPSMLFSPRNSQGSTKLCLQWNTSASNFPASDAQNLFGNSTLVRPAPTGEKPGKIGDLHALGSRFAAIDVFLVHWLKKYKDRSLTRSPVSVSSFRKCLSQSVPQHRHWTPVEDKPANIPKAHDDKVILTGHENNHLGPQEHLRIQITWHNSLRNRHW